DDADIAVGRVVASAPKVIVTEWLEGTQLSAIIDHGTLDERDAAGYRLARLHFSAPQRARLLHADPHPGNLRMLADCPRRVADLGAVARLPNGTPPTLGRLTRLALNGDTDAVMDQLKAANFLRAGITLEPQKVMDYLRPIIDPLAVERFTFTREWMRKQAA